MQKVKASAEISGVKKYKDPNYKDPEPSKLTVEEVTSEEEIVMDGQTIFKTIKFDYLSESNQKLILERGKGWITKNSECPCSSGKKFKKCCMELVKRG